MIKISIVLYSLILFCHIKNEQMVTIQTPDDNNFKISIISKRNADELEVKYSTNKLDEELLKNSNRSAFLIDNNRVLYRQFFKDIGFIFPSINDYKKAIKGKSYWNSSIQVRRDNSLAVSFWLDPLYSNYFLNRQVEEIKNYVPFEGNRFFLLDDTSVIMVRARNADLSDGRWFSSLKDFDYFYYILSGKEK